MLVETSFIECVLHRAEPQHVGASAFKGLQAARRHVAAWRDLLRSTQLHWVGIDDVSDGVPGLIEEFGLTASGAVHVATAISSKVDGFVTVDPAFGVVDKEHLPLIIDAKGAQLARRLRAGSRQ
ncbi:hypothetical protein BIU89_01980 [Curtobacterium sp. MCBA15_005]|nr:hypothetical protein BIU89_01980 [Curtobacterium sp. MCBA15_005]